MASQEPTDFPSHPKPEGSEAPSKNALKKAQKEKEKAEKAAKRAEQERQEKEKADANDTAKHLYGKLPSGLSESQSPPTSLRSLTPDHESQTVTIRARVHNARGQSAKLAFLDLRQRTENIQAVIAEGGGTGISRQMVKWVGGLSKESIVLVTGVIKTPKEPIHSASISSLEIHVESVFVVAEGPLSLPMQVKDAMRPPPMQEPEEGKETEVDNEGTPIVGLATRLNNRVLSLRTPTDQAVFQINGAVCTLFREFVLKHGFQELQTPKIAGAATEGGAGGFEVKYFESLAYLTQSPQFYKQMAIAGDMERVFEIGPVFRAENSNTPRHLTEVSLEERELDAWRGANRGNSLRDWISRWRFRVRGRRLWTLRRICWCLFLGG